MSSSSAVDRFLDEWTTVFYLSVEAARREVESEVASLRTTKMQELETEMKFKRDEMESQAKRRRDELEEEFMVKRARLAEEQQKFEELNEQVENTEQKLYTLRLELDDAEKKLSENKEKEVFDWIKLTSFFSVGSTDEADDMKVILYNADEDEYEVFDFDDADSDVPSFYSLDKNNAGEVIGLKPITKEFRKFDEQPVRVDVDEYCECHYKLLREVGKFNDHPLLRRFVDCKHEHDGPLSALGQKFK